MFDKVPLSPVLSFLQRKIDFQEDQKQNLREETELRAGRKQSHRIIRLKVTQVNRGDLFCKKNN